jgi:hypothetical protein
MTTKYLNTTKSLRLEHGLIDTFYSYATPVAFRQNGKLFFNDAYERTYNV